MHICVCPPQVALPGHQKKLLISIRKLRERCEPHRWAVATHNCHCCVLHSTVYMYLCVCISVDVTCSTCVCVCMCVCEYTCVCMYVCEYTCV